jgi:predicted NAD/FAD-binding protein
MNVATVPTTVTFGISRDHGAFEWAAASLSTLFAQRSNILSPRMWKLALDIIRFDQFALDQLEFKVRVEDYASRNVMNGERHVQSQETIGHFLEREGYSEAFRDDYLLPMIATLWTCCPDKSSLELPAVLLLRLM